MSLCYIWKLVPYLFYILCSWSTLYTMKSTAVTKAYNVYEYVDLLTIWDIPSILILIADRPAGRGEGAHPRCWGPCGPIRSDIGIRSGGRTKSLLDKNNVPRYPVANTDINPQLQAGCSENEDRPTEPPTLGKADPLSRRPSERPTHWAADPRPTELRHKGGPT